MFTSRFKNLLSTIVVRCYRVISTLLMKERFRTAKVQIPNGIKSPASSGSRLKIGGLSLAFSCLDIFASSMSSVSIPEEATGGKGENTNASLWFEYIDMLEGNAIDGQLHYRI